MPLDSSKLQVRAPLSVLLMVGCFLPCSSYLPFGNRLQSLMLNAQFFVMATISNT